MWPWEHAAVGYILVSLSLRASGRASPSGLSVVIVLTASQLPDLVDKPLSWELGVFPSGYAMGHSLLVALPVGIGVLIYARRTDRTPLGIAFLAGYWSHLIADVLDPLRYGMGPSWHRVLWPIVDTAPYEQEYGLRRGIIYLERFVVELASMDLTSVFILYMALPLGTLLLWIIDGYPGLSMVIRAVKAR